MTELIAIPSRHSAEPSSSSLPPISLGTRLVTLGIVIIPFAGTLTAIILLWGRGLGWLDVGLLLSMYILTVLGITVGFHRLFTHRSFETNRVIKSILIILGSMALQGPLLKWVAFHRRHHQFSDEHGDPHSPHNEEFGSILGVIRGAWYAHIGWFFDPDPTDLNMYVKDLSKSNLIYTLSALFPLWVAIGLLIPAVVGGLLAGNWKGAVLGLLWGGLVRIFLVHHVTWSINSVCHLWGRSPYTTKDHSRNNFLFGVLGLGEGWHNNHHAFPTSARHGLKWWQIDASYYAIRLLAFLGLASKIRLASPNTGRL